MNAPTWTRNAAGTYEATTDDRQTLGACKSADGKAWCAFRDGELIAKESTLKAAKAAAEDAAEKARAWDEAEAELNAAGEALTAAEESGDADAIEAADIAESAAHEKFRAAFNAYPAPAVSRQVRRAIERAAAKAATRPGPNVARGPRSLSAAAVAINSNDVTPCYGWRDGDAATFGPFKVWIIHDAHPLNPWEDYDLMTPMLYAGGRDGITAHDGGDDLADFFGTVTPAWVSRNWRAICDALQLDPEAHTSDAHGYKAHAGCDLPEARLETFRESLEWWKSEKSPGGWLSMLARLYDLAGVPHLCKTVNGYSQGDWCDVLLVATEAHAKRCGYDYRKPGFDMAESLKRDAELFRSWAFGDVYGYAVEDEDGETLDSCFGFFGAYWDKDSDVLGEAASAVAYHLKERLGVCINSEFAARGDFRDLRAEWKAAQAKAGGLAGGALCRALETQARTLLTRWKEARAMRREISAIIG